MWPVPLSVPMGRLRLSFFLLFTNCHSFINTVNFNMIFFMNLPWGKAIPIHSVKCTKLITFYAFLTYLLMYRFSLGHFLPVFVMEWCLRSAGAFGPCNWPVLFCGSEKLDLGTLKKNQQNRTMFSILQNYLKILCCWRTKTSRRYLVG